MKLNRREFLGAAPAAAALAALPATRLRSKEEDPLDVRSYFPVTRDENYLNSSYIAPPPTQVEEAGVAFVRSKTRDPISLGDMVAKADEVRGKFARLVGVSAKEIGFVNSTSDGENLVVRSLDLAPGDNVVIDQLHYMTTFVLYKQLEQTKGIEVRIAKAKGGAVRTEDYEPLVDRRTRLISVAWVSHQNGFRHDMRPLADLAHAQGAYLYSDAVQAVGMFPIALQQEGVDFITSGTYKWLLASFGVAPFYVRSSLLDKISPDRLGHLHVEKDLGDHKYKLYDSAKKFEYATLAFGPIYQLGAALDFLERVGVDKIEAHTVALAHELRKGLVDLGLRVVTPEGNRSSIVAFVNPQDPETDTRLFEEEKIRVSLRENGTQIRVGIALFNNASEIQHFLSVVDKLA